MYVTRPLSMYRKSPITLSEQPPDAPYSGYLVITDEEAEAADSFCWGICKRKRVKKLPFPQDKILTIFYSSEYGETTTTKVLFIPVLDKPLSSNRYYVVRAKGQYKGKVCKCSREMDVMTCCFSDTLRDKRAKPFNLRDLYQQVQIHSHQSGGFFAKSIAPDGIPPKFLRKKGWKVRGSSFNRVRLGEALGLDASLRELLPDFNFPIFRKRSASVVVGKWYCPFIFVREKTRVRRQMKKTMFYTMTLEQKWEEIYSRGKANSEDNVVIVNADVQREVTLVARQEAVKDDRHAQNGFIWFRVDNSQNGRRARRVVGVGLSYAIVENMRWVQEAGGWVNGAEREVKVERVEQITSESEWQRFGCYVLVESFVLRRMDGSLVLKCDFRHTHRTRCKWEHD
ncbi:hypothetical protein I3843_04G004400 [Carya illinoinensis]|nr:hypothetical protein I3760_04G004400 [Carya illinoinensis]KAG7981609.1 hypothetical protein I3843_04G004400 [Carya illinoinensis]